MPPESALQQRRLLRGRAFPWGKLQATQLDLLLSQPRLVCERASLSAKPRVRPPVKTMWSFLLPRLSSRLSYAPDVSLALARPDWATDLARYKCRQIRQQR